MTVLFARFLYANLVPAPMAFPTRPMGRLFLGVAILVSLVSAAQASDVAPVEAFSYEDFSTSYVYAKDGTGTQTVEAKVEILGQAAVQMLGQLRFPYVRGYSEPTIDFVKVVKPDGREILASEDLIQDLSAPVTSNFPIYQDLRVIHLTVPPFEVGDRLHYRVVFRILESESGYFGILHRFERGSHIDKETLSLDVPLDPPIAYSVPEGLEPEVLEGDGRRTYRWTITSGQVGEPEEEEGEPSAAATAWADVELGSSPSWAKVGEWYRGLSQPKVAITEEIRRLAAQRLEGIEDPRAKVEALYGMVTSEIRYLGMLLGSRRYEPRPAGEILDSGFGDCKDKHVLLASLLAASGFEASAVLVGAGLKTRLEVPTVRHFDHVITYVEVDGEPFWLDSTAVAPFGFFPPGLRGKRGLLIPPQGLPELVDLPVRSGLENSLVAETEAHVDEQGTLHGENSIRMRGDLEYMIRVALLNIPAENWPKALEHLAPDYAPGMGGRGTIESFSVSDPLAIEEPLEITFIHRVEGFLTGSGKSTLDLPLPAVKLASALPENDDGRLDAGSIHRRDYRLRLTLPGLEDVSPPSPLEIDYDNFYFRADYEVHDGAEGPVLEASRRLHAKNLEIDAKVASEYRAFRRAIKRESKRTFSMTVPEARGVAEDPEVLEQAVSRAIDRKDWKRAEPLARRLTELSPDEPEAWARLARMLEKTDRNQEAVEAWRRTLELDRFFEEGYFKLGALHQRLEDDASARIAFEQHLAIDPLHVEARRRLGSLLAKAERCEEAVPLLSDLEPDVWAYPWVLASLSSCLYDLGRLEEAREVHRELITLEDAGAVENAAYHLSEQDHCEDAVPLLRRLLELNSPHNMVRNTLAWCLDQTGDLEAAEQAYRDQLEIDPAHELASWNLSNLLYRRNELEASAEILAAYLRTGPEDEATVHKHLGFIYFITLTPDRAASHLEEALAAEPDEPQINRYLGILAARNGRYDDAVRLLEKAKALAPDTFADQDMLDYAKGELAKR